MAQEIARQSKQSRSFFSAFGNKKLIVSGLFYQAFFICLFSIFTIFILVKINDPLSALTSYLDLGGEGASMLDAYRDLKAVMDFSIYWVFGFFAYLAIFEGVLWHISHKAFKQKTAPLWRFMLDYFINFFLFLVPISLILFYSLKRIVPGYLETETINAWYCIPVFFCLSFAYFMSVSGPNISGKGWLRSLRSTFVNGMKKFPYYFFMMLSIVLVNVLFVVLLVQVPMYVVPLLLAGLMVCLFLYRLVMVYISLK